MGTKKIRTFWVLTSLAAICLQCELIAAEAPVTNYMSSYYDDAYHNEKSKSPGSPSPNPSHTYYPRHEADTEEEEDQPPHPHHKPHPHRGHNPKHNSHDGEGYGHREQNNYRHSHPPPKSGPYKPSNFYGPYNSKPQPSSKPFGKPYGTLPKSGYSAPTTGLPKYSITTSGPSYSGGSPNSRSAAPSKFTVGSSFSSSTGPGYSYSYGTKVTDEGKDELDKEHLEHSGPYNIKYEESNPPKESFNMNNMDTYKGDEERFKGGYTAGYPPISPYNTVKGNYDDYGHNDLSPKSPYKPSNKPVTFSYSAPIGSEYGAPVDTPAGGNSYDSGIKNDHSYTTTSYDKLSSYQGKGKPYTSKSPTFFIKSTPKLSYSSPTPKYQGAPTKYNGPPTKQFDGAKQPPSSTYATISNKSFAKSPSFSYGTAPPAPGKEYFPQGPSSNYGNNYYTNKDYEYSRSPSTSSVAKENSPPRLSSGSYSRGGSGGGGGGGGGVHVHQRSTATAGPPNFNRGPATFRGKGAPKNAYGYSYTAGFSIFNKKGRRGHSGGKGRHGHTHARHGLAQQKPDYDYDGMDSAEEAQKREQEALKNKRLFGSVGYSLGGARTFVKTPEKSASPNSNGYSNSAAYGGGYDMGTSYY